MLTGRISLGKKIDEGSQDQTCQIEGESLLARLDWLDRITKEGYLGTQYISVPSVHRFCRQTQQPQNGGVWAVILPSVKLGASEDLGWIMGLRAMHHNFSKIALAHVVIWLPCFHVALTYIYIIYVHASFESILCLLRIPIVQRASNVFDMWGSGMQESLVGGDLPGRFCWHADEGLLVEFSISASMGLNRLEVSAMCHWKCVKAGSDSSWFMIDLYRLYT